MNGSLSHDAASADATASNSAPLIVFEPRRALAAANHWVGVHRSELVCAVLLAAAAFQMFAEVRRKNITVDEIVMIPSAYYHLVARNLQLVNEHPPLAKFLAATPLLLVQPNEPQPADYMCFWESNAENFETISFWARLPMIPCPLALGVLIFLIALHLFGPRAALFATALFSFDPTVLAHGRVVQTDVPAAFGYLLFFFALYWYLRKPARRRVVALGAATAVAILAKFSMLLTAPILVIVFAGLWWRARRKFQLRARPPSLREPGSPRSSQDAGASSATFLKHAALLSLTVLMLINAAYFFQRRRISSEDLYWAQKSFPAHYTAVVRTVRAGSFLVPTDFVWGIFWQIWHNNEGHPASLLGQYGRMGWWYYFPVAFALKTTIPFLLLTLASLGWAGYQLIRKRDRRFLVLLIPFVTYTGFVLFSHINIGVRYYLPAFPFLFIMGGALIDSLLKLRRARVAAILIVCAIFAWTGIEAARAFPNYLPYMKQLASNHPHWWYLSDSNVEWGDDAKELAAYLRERGETRVQTAFLGDFFSLHFYGVDSISLISPSAGEAGAGGLGGGGGGVFVGSADAAC